MAVLLRDTAPPFREVLGLGRPTAAVYGVLWESAARDERGDCGGLCTWTVSGLAGVCSMGRATVITALKQLLDHGFIQFSETSTPHNRVWRVTHPKHLEAVRYSIDVMGLPSLKYNESTTSRHDSGTNRRSDCLASKESSAV